MDDVELLKAVKLRLGVTGSYHNDLLAGYIEDVKAYMLSAGVKPRVYNGTSAIGCIARGVADLWNYGAGEGKFSQVFYERLIQLATPMAGMEDGSEDFDEIPEEEIDEIVGGETYEPEPDYEEITDDEIQNIVDVATPEFATPDDIKDVINGVPTEPPQTEQPSIPELDEDEYEALGKEEIEDLFKTL